MTSRTVATVPSIHTYFDVVPESPDGQRLVYFLFDSKPLTHGRVIIANRDGGNPVEVARCPGSPHGAAQQGWLDNDHIYFTAEGYVHIATTAGEVVQRFAGAIDTFHSGTRRGLAPSKNWRGDNHPPKERAVYRIDIDDDGSIHELLDAEQAWNVCVAEMDLTGVRPELMNFKHSKWSPDGRRWFVVYTNEESKHTYPEEPRVKVMLTADEYGNYCQLIGSFGHHPNWLPDGSGVYAFGGGDGIVTTWDLVSGQSRALCRFPAEGHPAMHPDGRSIVTDSYQNGETVIYWHDLVTGQTQEISRTPDPRIDWQKQHPPGAVCHAHPVWSRDGQRIYFNAIIGELPELRVIELS